LVSLGGAKVIGAASIEVFFQRAPNCMRMKRVRLGRGVFQISEGSSARPRSPKLLMSREISGAKKGRGALIRRIECFRKTLAGKG